MNNDKIEIIDNDSIKSIDGGKFTVTDANGKVFDVGLSDIIDVSTTPGSDIATVSDVAREKMLNFSPNITDGEGVKITDSELLGSVKRGEAIALDVTFEATHSGDNLNDAVYTSDSLERDSQTWLFPFAKPLIKNHCMDEEPIGRARETRFGPSEFAQDRDAIDVTYRVSDADAMVKFADGRYKTMSIGARSGYIRCNTCGKDILKDGAVKFCGHWKGEMYAGKKATWTVENMTFREGSIVNAPADVYAQVKSIKIVKEKKEGNGMKDHNDASAIADMTAILDGQDPTNKTPEPNPTDKEPKEPTTDPTAQTDGEENKTELEKAQAKITDLEAQVVTLNADKVELETKLGDANDSLAVVSTDNESLKADLSKVRDQATRMAKFNLSLMKDKAKALSPELSDAELEGKNAKEINDMISEFETKTQTRDFTKKVPNPGAPVTDPKTDVGDNEGEGPEDKSNKKLTMKDMESVVSDLWSKH